MRLAIVSPYSWSFPGGVNEHIRNLGERLRERGHDVTVLAPLDGVSKQVRPPQGFVSLGPTIPVRANRSTAHLSLYPSGLRRAAREAREGGFDLLHLHEPLIPGSCLAALLGAVAPVVATFHAYREEGSRGYALAAPLLRRAARRITVRLAVSEAARSFVSLYFPGEYRVVPNGYDERLFRPQGPPPWRDDRAPIVLFVGREEPRKGLPVLLRAWERVAGERPEARLLVAGMERVPAWMLKGMSPAAADRVTCLGRLTPEGLASAYRQAWLFAAPSLGGESFGIILAEAMGSGTPVVASGIPGYRAVTQEAARLVGPGDERELASAIIDLLSRPQELERLREAGLARASRFAWDKVALQVERVYAEALRMAEVG
jgi:phosphatidylinositol alpha-mannosyltransferase